MQILGGNTNHVGSVDLFDFRLILVEPVGRISVILVGHALGEDLVGRVEAEDERIEDGVFRALDLVVSNGLLGEIVNVLINSLNGFDGALALGSHGNAQNAGMPEIRADTP